MTNFRAFMLMCSCYKGWAAFWWEIFHFDSFKKILNCHVLSWRDKSERGKKRCYKIQNRSTTSGKLEAAFSPTRTREWMPSPRSTFCDTSVSQCWVSRRKGQVEFVGSFPLVGSAGNNFTIQETHGKTHKYFLLKPNEIIPISNAP